MTPQAGAGSGQRLQIEPSSIGDAKQAFREAHDGVTAQLRQIRSAHQHPWAGDPVSSETATAVNNRTAGGVEANNAENVLTAYANQLASIIDSLERSEANYRRTEGENAALWGKHLNA